MSSDQPDGVAALIVHIVNTVDYKYLVKLIFEDKISAPQMKARLGDYWQGMKYVAHENPNDVGRAFGSKPDEY